MTRHTVSKLAGSEHERKRALVVGLGIAGMAAAIGLRDAGWEVLIVERSSGRRSGGYFVGVFPDGKTAAEDLGISQALHVRNPEGGTDWQLNARGGQKQAMGFLDQPGEPLAVMRGDIEAALWERLQGSDATDAERSVVEVRFSTQPTEIEHTEAGVRVRLDDAATSTAGQETFDLLIGADGLRSSVREQVFGDHARFMRSWHAMICAFELDGQVPGYGQEDGLTLALPRRAAWVFPFSDRTPTALLTYRTNDVDAQFRQPPVETLRQVYAGLELPVVEHTLDTVERSEQFLFDAVHSVDMPSWRQGRVVLVGDAAWCLTLYSGMGSTAALRGGAALGRALQGTADVNAALAQWEASMRPFITTSLRRARVLQHMFVPSNRVTALLRNGALALLGRLRRRQQAAQTSPPETALR